MTTTTADPFGLPGRVPDRQDVEPFGIPSDSGRATRTGDAEDRAEVPRDQWGRYLMLNEDGSRPAPNKGRTRVSTTKAALSNTFGIQKWSGRRIVQGLAMNPDAVAAAMRASAMPDGPDKERAFGRIADGAFQTGGGKERAGLGTEFHEITEDRNKGVLIRENVDQKWAENLAAYEQLLKEYDLTPLSQYLERQVLCPFNNAGTFDNIMIYWNPETEEYELVIVDLKTGRKLDLGWLEIEIQLWLYANAYAMWTTTRVIRADPKDPSKITDVEGFYEPMPMELRTDKAFIIHTPLDGTATLIKVDLSGVERYVRAAVEAKRANAEAPGKAQVIGTIRPGAFVAPAVTPPLAGEIPSREQVAHIADRIAEEIADRIDVQAHTVQTPQQTADALLAAERQADARASIARMDANGLTPQAVLDQRVADTGSTAPGMPPLSAVEPIKPFGVVLNETPKDPVTGRKKRACGFCHVPGHTQKNCPQNPASAKYAPPAGDEAFQITNEDTAGIPAGDPAQGIDCDCRGDGDFHPVGSGGCLLSTRETIKGAFNVTPESHAAEARAGAPYCTIDHVCQWTSQHPDAPGQWSCSISGKPGKRAWEADQTAVTPDPPFYGAPQPEQPEPIKSVAAQLAEATTVEQVLQIRGYNIDANNWSPELEEAGRLRYVALTSQ